MTNTAHYNCISCYLLSMCWFFTLLFTFSMSYFVLLRLKNVYVIEEEINYLFFPTVPFWQTWWVKKKLYKKIWQWIFPHKWLKTEVYVALKPGIPSFWAGCFYKVVSKITLQRYKMACSDNFFLCTSQSFYNHSMQMRISICYTKVEVVAYDIFCTVTMSGKRDCHLQQWCIHSLNTGGAKWQKYQLGA